jgi:opacity protein-like surface antigen
MDFGTQDVTAIGTSNISQNGMLVSSGTAAGPGTVDLGTESNFAPSFQAGYFQHFGDGPWLWGAKFSYSYLNTTSTVDNITVPQFGSFTEVATNTTTPFVGVAVARSFQTELRHQLGLMPFIGYSFAKGFVYLGGGPTGSETHTEIKNLIGFADLHGIPTDVSGAPQNFSASGWVVGGEGTVGVTYFLHRSWFLDVAYTYSRTGNQTFHYFSTFTNAQNPFGTTSGTLVGSSSGDVTTQGVTFTINMAFDLCP